MADEIGAETNQAVQTVQKVQKNPKKKDKFQEEIETFKNQAIFGKTSDDILKLRSRGEEDFQRDLKLVIQREYLTQGQYAVGVIAALWVSATIIFILQDTVIDSRRTDFGSIFDFEKNSAIFFISATVSSIWLSSLIGRYKRCDPDNKSVNIRKGKGCFVDGDCSSAVRPEENLCTRPTNTLFKIINSFFLKIVILIVFIVIFTNSDERLNAEQTFSMILYGGFFGLLYSFLFS